jgi:hypothetical protein
MGRLRGAFGSSRNEIWKRLSDEIGGQFVEGGFWKADRVDATHGEWTVTLDTYTVSTGKVVIVFTRLRAPFVNPEGFRFTVSRRGLFSGIGRMLGIQDVEVGFPEFDEAFVIKGSDESRLRYLFANGRIRELLSAQKDVKFSVKDDEGWFGTKFPEGVDELEFVAHGVIKDLDRLKQLYELFAETLAELCRMGSAYETDPGVRL